MFSAKKVDHEKLFFAIAEQKIIIWEGFCSPVSKMVLKSGKYQNFCTPSHQQNVNRISFVFKSNLLTDLIYLPNPTIRKNNSTPAFKNPLNYFLIFFCFVGGKIILSALLGVKWYY